MIDHGSDLHVRSLGDGPSILFVHAGIVDGAGWLPVAERVAAAGWRTIVPDVRGFGASPDPDGPFDHARDLAALLELLDVGPAIVVGWSMGGGLACALATHHPELVSRVALVNSVPPGFERDARVRDAWAREEQLWEAGDVDALADNDVQTWAVGPGRVATAVPDRVRDLVAATARDQARRWRDEFEAWDETAVDANRVRALTSLELAITSEHDYPDVRAAATSLELPVVEIAACGHAGPYERPDAYAAALLGWLDS